MEDCLSPLVKNPDQNRIQTCLLKQFRLKAQRSRVFKVFWFAHLLKKNSLHCFKFETLTKNGIFWRQIFTKNIQLHFAWQLNNETLRKACYCRSKVRSRSDKNCVVSLVRCRKGAVSQEAGVFYVHLQKSKRWKREHKTSKLSTANLTKLLYFKRTDQQERKKKVSNPLNLRVSENSSLFHP